MTRLASFLRIVAICSPIGERLEQADVFQDFTWLRKTRRLSSLAKMLKQTEKYTEKEKRQGMGRAFPCTVSRLELVPLARELVPLARL